MAVFKGSRRTDFLLDNVDISKSARSYEPAGGGYQQKELVTARVPFESGSDCDREHNLPFHPDGLL